MKGIYFGVAEAKLALGASLRGLSYLLGTAVLSVAVCTASTARLAVML